MILTYKECLKKYGSDYKIKKAIEEQLLFQHDRGYYSELKHYYEMELMSKKYPRAIYTGLSAYYYYGLTTTIPDEVYLATKRNDTRINDSRIIQVFVNEDIFDLGKTTMNYQGKEISIYNLERLLVDLIRFKDKIPFDIYKEIINNYRTIIYKLDFGFIESYARRFRTHKSIMNAISLEVL